MIEKFTWHKLSVQALEALINRDLEQASQRVGVKLGSFFSTDDAVRRWSNRLSEAHQDERTLDWIAQVVAVESAVIGHAGFHAPPDQAGLVEIAYSVVPARRGRGYAKVMVAELIRRAQSEPTVNTIRATIRPDNAASLATIRPFGFEQVGEQWDAIDGLELVFELTVGQRNIQ